MIQVTLRDAKGEVIFIGHVPESSVVIERLHNKPGRAYLSSRWIEDLVTPELKALTVGRDGVLR